MPEKPLAIDICCGKGGWTQGLQDAGYRVIGIDIKRYKGYPGDGLILQDAATITSSQLRSAHLIVASTPCQQFSIYGLPHFHPNPKPPSLGIALFRAVERACIESGRPYVMENVRSAQRFLGPSINHLGPFHLWGSAVPAIFPPELYKVQKGLTFNWPAHKGKVGGSRQLQHGESRATKKAADSAMIPRELGEYIGSLYRV